MSLILSPITAIKNPDLQLVVDLIKAEAKYQESGKNFITMGKFRMKKSAFKIVMVGELSTDGINCSTFGEGKGAKTSYSLGFIPQEEDVIAIEKFASLVDELCPDDYDSSPIMKDEIMYLKLKTKDGKRFNFYSNIKLEPKKYQEAPLYNGQQVKVTAEISAWFNFEDKKAGLTLAISKLEFELPADEQPAKRVKL